MPLGTAPAFPSFLWTLYLAVPTDPRTIQKCHLSKFTYFNPYPSFYYVQRSTSFTMHFLARPKAINTSSRRGPRATRLYKLNGLSSDPYDRLSPKVERPFILSPKIGHQAILIYYIHILYNSYLQESTYVRLSCFFRANIPAPRTTRRTLKPTHLLTCLPVCKVTHIIVRAIAVKPFTPFRSCISFKIFIYL